MKTLHTITIQATTAAAILGLHAGHSWIIQGVGLHPMAAGAIATALLVAPYITARRFSNV